jgi:hypothetical protein
MGFLTSGNGTITGNGRPISSNGKLRVWVLTLQPTDTVFFVVVFFSQICHMEVLYNGSRRCFGYSATKNQFHFLYPKINPPHGFIFSVNIHFKWINFLLFCGNPVPPQVDKFTYVAIVVRRRAGSRPLPVQRPLACRRRRRASSRPWPVGVRPCLPSAPPRVP